MTWVLEKSVGQISTNNSQKLFHQPEKFLVSKFVNSVKNFIVSEDGPTAVEYAVMLALIVIVCLTAIRAVGNNANARFNAVKNQLT